MYNIRMMFVWLLLPLLPQITINFVQSATSGAPAPAPVLAVLPAYEIAKPNCRSTCGSLVVPYPFGTTKGCYLEKKGSLGKMDYFFINCTDDTPNLRGGNLQVHNISLDDGHVHILSKVSRACYNESGYRIGGKQYRLQVANFRVNSARNKFTVIGCSTLALITGSLDRNYTTGCASLCDGGVESSETGTCSGIGCCQTSLPKGTRDFKVSFQRVNNSASAKILCSSAFVVDQDLYNFSSTDLIEFDGKSFPVMLDWTVGKETCAMAMKNKSSYACVAPDSTCTDSAYGDGTGYRCNCPSGFQGNPYLINGCIDIDLCATSNPCQPTQTCINLPGSYRCKTSRSAASGIAIGVSTSLLILVVGSTWIYWLLAKRKHIKQKDKFFAQNGGFMLREELSKDSDLAETARLFTEEDLKKATSNYDETGIIGRGGYGTVYKGVLSPNNRAVAIKKSKLSDQSQISQFINEVIILSRINHINVVKLIGCCLETEVPLLVYEFVNNGTLSDHIHGKDVGTFLSWESCLQIAAEIAGAVAYLHSAASPPIIHRDIKSTNILLDENFMAKVADFGASKVVPRDHAEIATLVQGTFGYMDPEYFHSSELTEKSDVYSFGVLLAELITGEPAVSFDRPEKDRSLAAYFISSVRTGNGMPSIIQKNLVHEEKNIQQIKQVAMLAARCLKVTGDKRPSMKEVAMELEGLKTMVEHPWVDKDSTSDHNETEYLLNESVLSDAIGSTSFGFSSIVGFDNTSIEMTRKVQFR
ncbi:putative wall-associated receptor kinase-like 16 isoform X1 [Apium graveolens]|uniref:putative wall-associated receptor kinase-like 16 isoform X1 n=1 Tax=Apium graveolens TaxID=4045 RepID=UPI003D78D589